MPDDLTLVERLCRCLAFHCVESENTLGVMEVQAEDMKAAVASARALVAEAGFDFDALYPVADRPVVSEVPPAPPDTDNRLN
jgi:hypothetical protein